MTFRLVPPPYGHEALKFPTHTPLYSWASDCSMWLQEERAEQLRSLSFLAGILLSFGMAALYQLVFTVPAASRGLMIVYALTIALTVRSPPPPLHFAAIRVLLSGQQLKCVPTP